MSHKLRTCLEQLNNYRYSSQAKKLLERDIYEYRRRQLYIDNMIRSLHRLLQSPSKPGLQVIIDDLKDTVQQQFYPEYFADDELNFLLQDASRLLENCIYDEFKPWPAQIVYANVSKH